MDNVAAIKERLNIVDVISGYIKTQKAGINFKARCPFHNEKTPSFYISPERQIWHCFGCQKGGDMFTFVQEMEGLDFSEALKTLALKAGVELERFNSKEKDDKEELYRVSELASRFFEKQLYNSPTGKKALVYLLGRGIKEETLKEFRVGFAPDSWNALSAYLSESGFKRSDIITAGLSIKKDGKDEIFDRFRSRITFPIADINGRIVGFTARIFGDNHPPDVGKYINTPQTPIYDKSRILYGLDKAKTSIRRQNRALLVEGNIDVIMSYQSGATNVAATSGTALTPNHLQILQRYTNNLDFCFDTDQAGSIATRRGIGMALARNANVSIVQIPDKECKDPADYVAKYDRLSGKGPKWPELAVSGKPAIEFYFEKSRNNLDLKTVSGKKEILSVMAPLIKRLVSQVERSHWVTQLATVLKTKEDAVSADIASVKDDLSVYEDSAKLNISPKTAPGHLAPLNEFEILNQGLLAVIFRKPELFKDELAEINHETLMPEVSDAIKLIEKSNYSAGAVSSIFKDLDNSKNIQIGSAYIKSSELMNEFTDGDLKNEFVIISGRLKNISRQKALEALTADIKEAEAFGDKNKVTELTKRISLILKNP